MDGRAGQTYAVPKISLAIRLRRVLPPFLLILAAAKCPFARTAPESVRPRIAPGDSAEQVVYGARVTLSEKGVAKGLLLAEAARVYQNGARMELQGVSFTFLDSAGLPAGVLTAREGSYSVARSRLEARGKVSIVRRDGRRLDTERAVYDHARSIISADSAYVFSESNPSRRSSGIGFESDARLRVAPKRNSARAPR